MKKKLWIINQYESLPSTGIGGRHRHLSRELNKLGYEVTLISARTSHLTRNRELAESAPEIEGFEGFKFIRLAVNKYKDAHDKKRIISWFNFAWKLLRIERKAQEKPDVIIYSSPSLVGYLAAYWLARKTGAKLIFEVRDIWPLTLIQIGGFSGRHPFIKFLQWIEDFAYKKSDFVISNIEGAIEHMKGRGLKETKFRWIPNGYSEQELKRSDSPEKAMMKAIEKQNFSVTYTGAVGEANCLDTLIDASYYLKSDDRIHVNIVGSGRLLESLKKYSVSLGLTNVHFWGAIPKSQVSEVLKASDCSVICWKRSPLYRYGVAANKIFDYLYSGKPILNCYSGGKDLVSRYNAGLTIPAEEPKALAGGITKLVSLDKSELELLGSNGTKKVRENHEYGIVALKLDEVLREVFARYK